MVSILPVNPPAVERAPAPFLLKPPTTRESAGIRAEVCQVKDFSVVPLCLSLLLALSVQACGAMVTPGGDAAPGRDASSTDAARTCTRNEDCASGQLCDGPPGCGVPWTCVAGRECATIAGTFCACDGFTTFYASPGCVGRPYSHGGPCERPPPVDAGGTDSGTTGRCSEQTPDEVRAPNAVYCDQSIDLTLRQNNAGGCGCTVTPVVSGGAPTGNISVCDCCDVCDCIDGVVETSLTRPPAPCVAAPTEVTLAGRSVWIVPRPTSAPATWLPTITQALVQGPRSTAGPSLWWVHLQGTIERCASSGTLVCASHRSVPEGPGTRLELGSEDCSMFDCDGPTHPVPFDTWHSLGALASGAYRLVVPGRMDALFAVP